MLEFLTEPSNKEDAINILKEDHTKVKELFDRFQDTDDRTEKLRIARQAIEALKVHAELEEKIFYRTLRPELKEDIMNEADEEHHVAKVLIAELSQMGGREEHFDAKFHVLSENIRHHIKEEEGKMMPEARSLDIDFVSLGQHMLSQREKLEEMGVPECDEERMVKGVHGNDDSPAKNARITGTKRKAARKAKSAKKTAKKRVQAKSTSRNAVKAKSKKPAATSSYSSGNRKKALKTTKTRRTGTR